MSLNRVEAIDRLVLDALRKGQDEGDPDLVAEVAAIFFADTVERLGSLRKAIGSADAVSMELEAHTLKSSSASLGAMPLSSMCSDLEEKGRAGVIEGASEALSRIEEEFARARAILETEISSEAYELAYAPGEVESGSVKK